MSKRLCTLAKQAAVPATPHSIVAPPKAGHRAGKRTQGKTSGEWVQMCPQRFQCHCSSVESDSFLTERKDQRPLEMLVRSWGAIRAKTMHTGGHTKGLVVEWFAHDERSPGIISAWKLWVVVGVGTQLSSCKAHTAVTFFKLHLQTDFFPQRFVLGPKICFWT